MRNRFVISEEYQYSVDKNIHLSRVVYDKDVFEPSLFSRFQIQQPVSLYQSVVKRKSEFLAGRIAAKNILHKLAKVNHQVAIGENRSPVWPQGYIGSISHTEDEAICLMASDQKLEFIGVDIEKWLTEETAIDVGKYILSEPELRLVLQLAIPFSLAVTIVFSAKESLFKALYPSVGRYFGFEAAKLTELDIQNNTFKFELVEELEGKICASKRLFTGTFISGSDSVITYI